jgi:hypothetical protein
MRAVRLGRGWRPTDLKPNLMGIGAPRTHIRIVPICGTPPYDYGPSFLPPSWGRFLLGQLGKPGALKRPPTEAGPGEGLPEPLTNRNSILPSGTARLCCSNHIHNPDERRELCGNQCRAGSLVDYRMPGPQLAFDERRPQQVPPRWGRFF